MQQCIYHYGDLKEKVEERPARLFLISAPRFPPGVCTYQYGVAFCGWVISKRSTRPGKREREREMQRPVFRRGKMAQGYAVSHGAKQEATVSQDGELQLNQ